jgi:sulfate-transporting ATPase
LLGLGNGGVYAALALALVLTYRSSGVINFATGAIALYGAYTFAWLRAGKLLIIVPGLPTSIDLGGQVPFIPAIVIALALTALLGAGLYYAVFRALEDASPLARAVASLGVLMVLQSLMAHRVGTKAVSVKAIFPSERWRFGSLVMLSDRFYLALTVVALAIALALMYRWTRFGLLTRANASSITGALVSGVRPTRIAVFNWMIGGAVAGMAGILISPLTPLTPITYTLFVVPALAAAVVGGFQNLLPTVAAGIAIGMLQSEAITLSGQHSWMPKSGAPELVPLVVILIALLLTASAMPMRGALVRLPIGRAPRPRSFTLPTLVGSLVGVVALLITHGSARAAVIGSLIAAVIGLSLVVVTGFAGQVSLAQLALAGVGAFTLSGLTQSWGVPFPFAPLLAALASTVVGVVIGLPALRLRGLTLGIATLALAYGISAAWFRNTQIVSSSGARVTQPKLFGLDLSVGIGRAFPRIEFGLLCLAVLVITALAVARLRVSALGSAMLAVRSNERSAAGIGVNVVRVKILSFAIASFIAGIGGSLLAYRRSVVTYDSFATFGGLTLLATAYLAGITSVSGGIIAGGLATGGIVYFGLDRGGNLGDWFEIINGVALIAMVIANPEGIANLGHRLADKLARRRSARERPEPAAAPATSPTSAATGFSPSVRRNDRAAEGSVLDVAGLTVVYGGVVAVSDVSLTVEPGTVVGLIGPNGAGKTSVIDAITGFAAARGTVHLLGQPIEHLATHTRVHRGLARTFQAVELYEDLSVEENIRAALSAVPRDQRRTATTKVLELVGIAELRDRSAGELSQGQRQLVSIARASAVNPSVLLLDEPAAGLDTGESKWLGERIRNIANTGVGVLLVDHDVALVLGVCDYIYVLNLGRVIAHGTPAEVRSDRGVAEAYFGDLPGSGATAS